MPASFRGAALMTLAIWVLSTPAVAQTPLPAASPPIALPAQDDGAWLRAPRWDRLTGDGPPAREDATWTVDADGAAAYLFGGRDGQRTFDDLWRFDLVTDAWTRLQPERGPAARFGHAAAFVDGAGLVVFGGQRGTDFFDDLWAYDPVTGRWRRLPDRGRSPAARYGTCAVVDEAGRFVISHGFTFNGRFDDTRAYDFVHERWDDRTPEGRRPGERCLHDCFRDADGRLVLYGGQDNERRALGDLWLEHEERWSRRPDPRPAARRLYALAEAGPEAWLFGGAGLDDDALDDLWRIDRATLAFERVRPAGRAPAARSAAVMVADPIRRRLLLFGGEGRSAFGDLWQLSDATDTAAPDPAASPTAGAPAPAS
jgi:hypothetical protein